MVMKNMTVKWRMKRQVFWEFVVPIIYGLVLLWTSESFKCDPTQEWLVHEAKMHYYEKDGDPEDGEILTDEMICS